MTRKRRVRLHFQPGMSDASIEGVLIGRLPSHYLLEVAEFMEAEDRTHEMGRVEVPKANVLFLQRL